MKEAIAKVLMEMCHAQYFRIEDESYMHQGHREASAHGNTHFRVTIVSDQFEDQSRLERHRYVYKCCNEFINQGVHALTIQAYTSGEWSQKNG